jgi:hypothetical protein
MREIRIDMATVYKLPHPQLKSYLNRQVAGSDAIYTTPFGGDEDMFWHSLDEWIHYLQSHLEIPRLLAYELEMAEKVGPMSFQKPLVERLESISSYYSSVDVAQDDIDPEYVDMTLRRWGKPSNLQMLSYAQAVDRLKRNTNSGSPYFTRRGLVLEKGLVGKVDYAGGSEWYTTTPDGRFRCSATLGWRGQEGGPNPEDTKQRDLWMFPMDLNIQENRVYMPLITYGQQSKSVPGWLGNDAVDLAITKMFKRKEDSAYIAATDFTKYDQHFGKAMQNAVKLFITKAFADTPDLRVWLDEIFPAAYAIPLITRWGRMMTGWHGEGSGSGGTQGAETPGHSILQTEAASRQNQVKNLIGYCLGDDGILTYPGLDIDTIMDVYQSHGMEMNPSKQSLERDACIYLRRYHEKDYIINGINVGIYPTTRALGKLKFLERFHDPKVWNAESVCTRSLSIIENCCYHPLRDEFFKFCMERDKFRLGLDIPGYIDNFEDKVRDAVANRVIGYQYTDEMHPKPAKSWWVYQKLKAMQ